MKKAKQGNWLVALSMLLSSSWAHADWTVNMREGVTAISRDVYSLHMIIFWVCVVIGVLVFGVMILSMLMHRKSLGVKPADFHHSTKLEIIWTIIPVVILVVMAIPSTATLTAMYDASDADIDIEVRGLQWKWQYTYLNDDPEKEVKFISSLLTPSEEIYNDARKRENYLLDVDNEVVIPINKKIRFLITSQDVIHAWWVPDFAVKKDAIPGFVHESWAIVEEPGIYRGQCAELCGKQHGFMPIVVRAVEQAEYEEWLVGKQEEAKAVFETVGKEWTQEELMVKGEEVYTRVCSVCHQANGQGLPPAFPSLVGTGLAVGSMQEHIDIVLHGKAGTAMQSFSSQLNAAEIAAVVIYERNAWGNDMGDMIQPREINAMMNGGQ
ncbi:cytochrome c oxidase subunit II [Pseudomonadales bacterium]|jgi:cytochrome c oxidase subunit 2|nr:cytochrome c oxidase subunit II [Pseudomonadales bacterium]MDB2450849.1 cytochrome c oxidase subunit II [Pseudomonadales bacterium]MDC0889411.1 cytochrome c oxidase subunit II [bacterium]MDC1083398.1 cytochrome c oxidase subunit II [Pseudomonadales bacterium]MDC6448824.1 cytochrome c oxidase subunit II [Pseudomonadales bacterium]|tara:strand:+ start:10783 stop:11925 length:1143 start_codon:yes stop_codon:yes gene_type:complete